MENFVRLLKFQQLMHYDCHQYFSTSQLYKSLYSREIKTLIGLARLRDNTNRILWNPNRDLKSCKLIISVVRRSLERLIPFIQHTPHSLVPMFVFKNKIKLSSYFCNNNRCKKKIANKNTNTVKPLKNYTFGNPSI